MRTGMDQQQRPRQSRERQGLEELALRSVQLRIGPLCSAAAHALIVNRRLDGHDIVIALNDPRTFIGQAHGHGHHLLWIATIAHQVTQQSPSIYPLRLCMRHASVQSLQIGMDV